MNRKIEQSHRNDVSSAKPPSSSPQKSAQAEARLLRWQLLRTVQGLLPEERVASCMHCMRANHVDVCYSPDRQSAHYRGLITCGSVWVCPSCAARISEYRRVELEEAINNCLAQGGAVYLATYTVSHQHYDTLSDLLRDFLAARKRLKQGRAVQQLKQQFGMIGTVSAREVTWSEQNGWHPHCHELIFFAQEIDEQAYAEKLRQQWQRCAEREGLSMNERGFQLDRTYGAVQNYIAKFGKEPVHHPWGSAAELTKAHIKRGRSEEHLTPFAMLAQIAQGRDELRPLFLEYARWFKGKRQLVWSRGLRDHLLEESEELPDEEITQEDEQEEVILLGQLNRSQWSIITRRNAKGRLLEVARSGSWLCVRDFLRSIGADREDTPLPLLLGNRTRSASAAAGL